MISSNNLQANSYTMPFIGPLGRDLQFDLTDLDKLSFDFYKVPSGAGNC